jgi:hypothetical protein
MDLAAFRAHLQMTAPPAPESRLREFETSLGCALPDDYRAFLAATNGGYCGGSLWFHGPTPDGSPADAGVHHVGGFRKENYLSLTTARALYGPRIPRELLWIMDDPLGNAICLGLTGRHRGRVYFWDHECEPDPDAWDGSADTAGNVTLLADSFTDFVAGLRASDA